ncbi:MAG: DUF5615 family PIN-like protein [Bryobacteraceae bacterium]
MRFLVDNQLPVALARFLGSRGVSCQHVLDLCLAQASDSEIWRYAAQHRLILISKDEDFFHLAGQPSATVQFVWVRLGNCRKQELLAAIERVWPRVHACLEAGDRTVEVR